MDQHDFSTALAALPRRRDQLLPALHAVHHVAGWLPEAAIVAAARHVYVPLSEVYGIVTSYSEFRLSAPDPERVEVCTGLSCRIAGADDLRVEFERLGRSVEAVPCRFLCAVAPVVEHKGEYHGRLAVAGCGAVLAPRSRRPRPVGEFAALSALPVPQAGTAPGSALQSRREQALERLTALAGRARVVLPNGVAARAAGAHTTAADIAAQAAALAAAPVWLDGAGSDPDHHALPLVTVYTPDGGRHRFERVTSTDTTRIAAAIGGRAMPEVAQPSPLDTRRVSRNCGVINPEDLDQALAAGAYRGLEQALAGPSEQVIALVREAGLRGRGGAYFPVHIKWSSARANPGPRYLVVNAEEGEPGVFKDRHLMEGDPHSLVEGVLIAAYAIGAARAIIYINGQAERSAHLVERAIAEAGSLGLTGVDILGSGWSCDIEVYRGAGGYVCGEESVMLNSIEGERAVPRYRPPLPTDAGLFGQPTVINNVETICNLPQLLTEGVDWFRAVGTADFPGTKLMSLSGALRRPGLYEVPLGASLRRILDELGGGPLDGRQFTFAVVGGPSGGLLPAAMLDVPILGGMLHPTGAVLGAGGVIVLDERTPLHFVLRELTAYNKAESCGKCTPCREGSARILSLLDAAGDKPLSESDRALVLELCDVLQTASLCGLGQMAPGPVRSALTLF